MGSPRPENQAPPPATPAAGEYGSRSRTATSTTGAILVVDDDESFRNLIILRLTSLGYRVDEASSASEARNRLRVHRYSLILTDYEMPGESGLELVRYVQEVHPDLPTILVTGHDEPDLARSAITLGAVDFLSKPFNQAQLARVIEQSWARAQRDRERAAQQAQEILSGTVRALIAAVDAKDSDTASHSARVAAIAVRLGEALGLTAMRLKILEIAALMHDVGKIGMPEGILLKDGRLTDEEWELVRQHPARSATIIGEIASLGEVATIARHHHERMDGSGYPDGLEGDAIHPLARIVGIADAYETLTAHRTYRAAVTPAEARKVIRAGLGTQFDREFGEVFLSLPDVP